MSSNKAMPKDIAGDPLYSDVWSKLYYNNQNFLAAFCGGTGTGKSYSALSMAWALDRDRFGGHRFSIDNVVFEPDDFISVIRDRTKRGTFIVWDETGVGINSRRFFDRQNIMISAVTQTFRWKNFGVLYTVPSFGYVDKQVRGLFHAYVEMNRPFPVQKVAVGRWYWLEHNARDAQKIFYPLPRVSTNNKYYKISEIAFPLPPKELINAYEEKKKAKAEEWYAGFSNEFRVENVKKLDKQNTFNSILDHLKDNGLAEKYFRGSKVLTGDLALDFKLNMGQAEKLGRLLKNSGLNPFKEEINSSKG